MGILEKIAEIEREISRTQKNKATEYHLGLLKAKLAKYRVQLLEPSKGSSAKGEGFDVMKSGDARVALIGFPSVGKSTLLNRLTKTHSEAGAYEFTTLTCIPGKIEYNGANIQLLDLPGIIEGASQERELEAVGIRLNKEKPNVYFKVKKGGGISFNATVKLNHLNEKMVYHILHDYKIFNAEVLVREDVTVDEFIDVCYNKIDSITLEELDKLAHEPNSLVISCEMDLNLDFLVDQIWKNLNLLRVYTKKRGGKYPDFGSGLIVRRGATVEHVCHVIHRSLVDEFKYALVWGISTKHNPQKGISTKHNPQKVGSTHIVENEDVIQGSIKNDYLLSHVIPINS
ncbi:5926_t:CDS:10 [Entrophospora sp. SA101]|nr:5926_t:CDS:10 [Entrophospora sp. SA101]